MSRGFEKCRHCLEPVDFDVVDIEHLASYTDGLSITQFSYECDLCGDITIYWRVSGGEKKGLPYEISIWPFLNTRKECPPEVPSHIADDYKEACLILPISPKASAALSRRCLQNILREVAKVKPSELVREIQEVIENGNLPSVLIDSLDAVRKIGNFAAHPIKSKNTGEIVNVESREAAWSLDVIEQLFDYYYIQPVRITKMRNNLNAKLDGAGKPPMK